MAMLNVYAYRATDPYALKRVADPVGPDNTAYLRGIAGDAALVIAAWGVIERARNEAVLETLLRAAKHREVWCLGRTKGGYPRHPLYLRSDVTPSRYL